MKVLVLLLTICAALAADDGWRIISGVYSNIGDNPMQVAITYNGRHHCGGSILDQYTILSAAHCFEKQRSPYYYKVRTGSINNNYGGQLHSVSSIRMHNYYR